ncbi:MAG: hypothetical protein A3C93_01115 [Candidatus Lloydbacteria bacterium RIFCSPHIGHO2_02_FULL_54_17]|uniref:Peptidase M50 domain-containing protein n=1 Tax=Candidatus Lloydbacteria bacterium RIFCSPHIGHO2_02_FULL_54_17 TaxID=1798664 RepID=A0A1G2DCY1_9BACT|nr:MAG: hypothetical protein A2762_06425 [Candidatus Lloydbacteria bacterium RIFCSPHIGHO2_01_FULL_54_11]OGZ11499.1 MAG: hypothetical protein A3C93_01115 [Candidatus Lloydbacteria bacterium RIFCSPHIGHO2_02_FULL_54_17]OGZ14397.1 MAG: hypothetical protein A2948_00470 [Candidatus Lloydbacteria bacterium RIFCSPLOWO2_01_FULL_54_18]
MTYVWIGLIILFAVLIHEVGHLIAMRKCGVWVDELGVGLPWGPRIGWTFPSKKYPGKSFAVSLYPLLLLGAFVKPENEGKGMKELSYHDQAFIYGAGIIGNFVMIALGIALIGALLPEGRSVLMPLMPFWKVTVASASLWWGLLSTVVVLLFARPITQYLFPVMAVVIMYWITTMILGMPFETFVKESGGIVAIAQLGEKFSKSLVALTYFGVLVSYLLALTNLLPIYPLDGGQTMQLLGEKYAPRIWGVLKKVGITFFLILVVFALAGDIRRLIDLFY